MPKVGDIEDGYRFKGGDASQQENWEPAQAVAAAPAKPSPRPKVASGMSLTGLVVPPAMQEAIRPIGKFAGEAAIPAGLSMIPPAVSAAFPANLPFVPLEQGAMSVLGTYLNKQLGISDPSGADYALAGGLPVGAGVAGHIGRAIKPFVPMSKAAETIQPLAHAEAVSTIKSLRSGLSTRKAFEQATKQGVSVPLDKTAAALKEIEQEVINATPEGQRVWASILKKTGIADDVQRGVTPAKLQNLLGDIGRMEADAASSVKGNRLQADKLGKLFSSLSADLDQVPALEQARALFKREKVLDEINEEIAKAFRLNAGQSTEKFSANKVVNALQDKDGRLGKFFAQSFSPQEQKDTIEFFKFLNTIPGLSPPMNLSQGFQKVGRAALVGGSVGVVAGKALGMDPTTSGALGTGAALIAGPAEDIAATMYKAWQMDGGKQLITSLLKNSDGALTPQVMGTIGAFVAGKMATPPTQPSNTIRPPMELERAFMNQR